MDWTRGHTIGHGSSATVSLATSRISGDVFAVKSSELSHSGLLQREQKILSSLSSPQVVCYRGCDITREHNKLIYNLFMEYVPGGSLADAVRVNGGGLDESTIAQYTRQILQGLEYLHSSGLAHCDIKGSNILIGKTGAKIADFGCGKRESEARPIGGTPAFMAPEVARGEDQGIASDIWSLGCTVIEMARGGSPWGNGSDPVSVMYRVAYSGEAPEVPCFLSEEAKDFLRNCLKRDQGERWTASQLLKHPFVNQLKIEESNSTSSSPTSVLDQGFWDWVEESEESVENAVGSVSHSGSPVERIRRLGSSDGEGPNWEWGKEKWITIRENKEIEEEGKDEMVSGSGGEISESVEKEESNVGNADDCGINWEFWGSFKFNCRKHRHPEDVLLYSLSSRLHV
ncbi:mitogen-activated protein kinase kinase kinase 18 [Carica papaya]|uniref:mitogen-activated protein kinase kinase kinase 18 n=1 Tax=Carica papaya TaxID=3649 RepID=UPI000B8CFE1A|nr:mitogen-activated protein kinase kinase kinase 18 [Carica papaya]